MTGRTFWSSVFIESHLLRNYNSSWQANLSSSGSWKQTKPADRHQSSVSLGDVLSVAPSARTSDSHTRREHHFLLGDVSARDY